MERASAGGTDCELMMSHVGRFDGIITSTLLFRAVRKYTPALHSIVPSFVEYGNVASVTSGWQKCREEEIRVVFGTAIDRVR